MSQDQEYQNLAKRFADLWQERVTAMMHDGEFVRMLLKMVQTAPFSATADTSSSGMNAYASAFTAPPAGSPAHASDTRDDAMARLERSLASIERRIAGIEAGAAKPRAKRTAKTVAKAAKRSQTGKSRGSRVKT